MTPDELRQAQLLTSITKLEMLRIKRRFLEMQAAGVKFTPKQLAALRAAADRVLQHSIRAAVEVGAMPALPGAWVSGGNASGN